MQLTFGSVCSGIEAASVAWEPLGWRAVWFAEVDKAASEVLAHRFPAIPNHGDMTRLADMIRRREIPAPDVLVGGTPCQAFSLAGRRQGLADERGALTLAYVELANAIDEVRLADCLPPCIIVWENVPGVLSSKDNAFGCFLAGVAGESEAIEPGPRPEPGRSTAHWAWEKTARLHRPKWTVAGVIAGPERSIAWVVRDAQFFGLAQRRRRVFVVAGAGSGFDPGSILLEFDGVRRDSAPSRKTRKDVAGTLDARTTGGGFPGSDGAANGHVVPCCGGDRGAFGLTFAKNVCPTLRAGGNSTGGDRPPGTDVDTADSLLVYEPIPPCWDGRDVSQTLDAVLHKGQTMPEKNRFPAVLQPIPFDTTQITSPRNYSQPPAGDPCHSLAAGVHPPAIAFVQNSRDEVRIMGGDGQITGALSAESGTHQTTYIAFTAKDYGGDAAVEICPTLRSMNHSGSHANGGGQIGIAYSVALRGRDGGGTAELGDDLAGCLRASGGGGDKPHVLTEAVCVTGSVTHTLKAEGFDGSEDGTGRGQPIVTYCPDIGGTLKACAGKSGTPNGAEEADRMVVYHPMAVRRLMPVECERLQGFPDNWTLVPTGACRKLAADGPRYKQLGNSMAVNVMRWIGSRIDAQVSLNAAPIGHNTFDYDEILG